MLTSVEAVYRNGKIELLEPAPDRAEGRRVVVTFLPPSNDTSSKAAAIRARAGAIAEDWDHPNMDVYDEQ